MMDFLEYEPLHNYATLRVGGRARYFFRLRDPREIGDIIKLSKETGLPVFVLGGGSNVVIADGDLPYIFVKNELHGKEAIEASDGDVVLSVGAGEHWDSFVRDCVADGLLGLEALSAIPGTVGAAPIQNIGAYGSEVSSFIEGVEAYDTATDSIRMLAKSECCFAYRDSLFRQAPHRFIILWVVFRLPKGVEAVVPDYPGVREFLGKDRASTKDIRTAIMTIRSKKLPDPSVIPNVGSFFKNPTISKEMFEDIRARFPQIKYFPTGNDMVKIPAGWLIETAGLKGKDFGRVGTYEHNALVLVNRGGASSMDIMAAQSAIKDAVFQMFGISLETEPIFLNS